VDRRIVVKVVPLVDAEVSVEVVGERVPGDLSAHPPSSARCRPGCAGDLRERGVTRVVMGEVRDVIGHHRQLGMAD
jgi:hypothetical protein